MTKHNCSPYQTGEISPFHQLLCARCPFSRVLGEIACWRQPSFRGEEWAIVNSRATAGRLWLPARLVWVLKDPTQTFFGPSKQTPT